MNFIRLPFIILSLVFVPLMAWWTQSNVNFYWSHLTNEPHHLPYWIALLATVVLNVAWFPLNIILSIIRLFI